MLVQPVSTTHEFMSCVKLPHLRQTLYPARSRSLNLPHQHIFSCGSVMVWRQIKGLNLKFSPFSWIIAKNVVTLQV